MYRAAGALHRSTLAALPLRARPLGNAAAVLLRLRALRPVLVALALPAAAVPALLRKQTSLLIVTEMHMRKPRSQDEQ